MIYLNIFLLRKNRFFINKKFSIKRMSETSIERILFHKLQILSRLAITVIETAISRTYVLYAVFING